MRNRRSPEFFHLRRILFQEAVQLLLGSGHGDKIVCVRRLALAPLEPIARAGIFALTFWEM
jgi:hypothetical protein